MALFDDTRSDWGAKSPNGKLITVSPSKRTEFMNHWDGGPTGLFGKPHSACLDFVRSVQASHQAKGWTDIGYNGLVCVHARAIEGRGIDYVGAHCPDYNTVGYGWQFTIGKGETATAEMFARMAQAYSDCVAHSGHGLAKLGHRDGYATECPGDQIEAWVNAGMPAPAPQEGLMALTDQQQLDMYNRVMGGIPAGDARGRKNPDGTPARVLDTLDGNYLVGKIDAIPTTAEIAAAVPAGGTIDYAALAAAVVDELASRGITMTILGKA